MSTTVVDDAELVALLTSWLPDQRWFAGKGAPIESVELLSRTRLSDDESLVCEHVLARVRSGGRQAVYQVPLSHVVEVPQSLQGTVVGHPTDGSLIPCDALRDPRAARLVADLLTEEAEVGALRFRAGAGVIDPEARGRALAVEQSNTTVVYDDAVLVKWFRQVPRGINPDVELHESLSAAGCPAIAELRGHVETLAGEDADAEAGTPVTLAMVQEFLPGCADGWSMATASVRDLLAEADLLAEEVGTDFADEAHRLGEAVARVHADLAAALGTSTVPASRIADGMRERLQTALEAAPELREYEQQLGRALDEVAELPDVVVQRVHGDLHLGQTLRAIDRWVVIDFEGEPSAALEDRMRPDSPLRDVAGMLRSFDYASGHALVGEEPDRQRRFRAREWTERNTEAFCSGYAEAAGGDPRDATALLRAYLLDKALYEVVYEVHNRPAWVTIPRAAVQRLLAV